MGRKFRLSVHRKNEERKSKKIDSSRGMHACSYSYNSPYNSYTAITTAETTHGAVATTVGELHESIISTEMLPPGD